MKAVIRMKISISRVHSGLHTNRIDVDPGPVDGMAKQTGLTDLTTTRISIEPICSSDSGVEPRRIKNKPETSQVRIVHDGKTDQAKDAYVQ